MKSDFHRMLVFAQIVESGSMTKAADELDVSKSVLSHHLQSLEQHLGVKLLTRTTRRQSLTLSGQRYYQRCLEMKKLLSLAEEEVRNSDTDLAGTIAITSPHTLMTHIIGPSMCEFVKQHPRIEPRLYASDMRMNLIDKYLDLAITVGQLPDSTSRAIKIGELEQVLCCSPEYIEKRNLSLPITETELTEHDYIANQWEGINVERKFPLNSQHTIYRFQSTRIGDSVPTIRMMALSGLGIACLPILAIKEELESGHLIKLTSNQVKLSAPVWIVHNFGTQVPARIRAIIELIKENARVKLQLKTQVT